MSRCRNIETLRPFISTAKLLKSCYKLTIIATKFIITTRKVAIITRKVAIITTKVAITATLTQIYFLILQSKTKKDMEPHTDRAASKREQAQTHRVQLMMLDIDGVLTQHQATPTDVLTAAQALAVSAIGDLTNKTYQTSAVSPQTSDSLHRFADLAAEQIRAAMHARIDEGKRADW